MQGEEDEEKEQCSPVSILEPPFQDDGRESGDAEEDDYDLGYENVQSTFLYIYIYLVMNAFQFINVLIS